MMKHPLDWTPRFEDWEDPWFPADRKLLDPLFSRSAARQRGYCNILYPANLWCFTKLSHGFQKITRVLPGFFGHNTVLFHMKIRVRVQRGVSGSPIPGGICGHFQKQWPGDESLGRGLPGGHHGDLYRQDGDTDGGLGGPWWVMGHGGWWATG